MVASPLSFKDIDTFLDIRHHGFLRVATIVPVVHVCDPDKNVLSHMEKFDEVYAQGAQLALAPELGLSSYTAADKFKSAPLLKGCLKGVLSLIDSSRTRWANMMIVIGTPMRIDGAVYNVSIVILNGKVLGIIAKSYLPTYGEFYERRWFTPVSKLLVKETNVFGYPVQIGNDLLFTCEDDDRFAMHVEICEDLFVPVTPGSLGALAGATVLCNASASDITLGKEDYRRMLVRSQSARCMAAQLYQSAGYGESTGDLCWDGHGIIAENGAIMGETERFVRKGEVLVRDIDLGLLVHERMRQGTFQDNAAEILGQRPPFRRISFKWDEMAEQRPVAIYQVFQRDIDPHPFVPSDPAELDRRCKEIKQIQATALARRIEFLPPHMQRVFIGDSGGGDSAWTKIVACEAMDYLGLPRTNVVCVRMRGFGTTDDTFEVAGLTSHALGVTLIDHDITEEVKLELNKVGYNWDQEPDTLYENAQAWTRTQVLLRYSAKMGGIVLCTGTLSELALGWCTMFGDHIGHYGVNVGLAKTMVRKCIDWARRILFKDDPVAQEAIQKLLDLKQSPELLPASADGKILQITEDKIGPYELHDFSMSGLARYGKAPSTILRMAMHAYTGVYDYETIRKWLTLFIWRFTTSQQKRAVSMEGPKLGLTSLSSRGDWRCPADSEIECIRQDTLDTPEHLAA